MAAENSPWPVPLTWKWGRFADIAEVASNLIQPSDVPSLPHIAPNHIESGRPRLLPYATVKEDGVTSPKHRFFPGQILYSKIRPYLRKAVLVDFEGVCSADMYPLNVRCNPHYLLWWLLSPGFNNLAMEHQGRTVLPKINQDALYRVPVPLPPDEEQQRIASKLNCLFRASDHARSELNRVSRLGQRYKHAILIEAFRGNLTEEWRANHSEEIEPTSELVARTPVVTQPRGGREASGQIIEGIGGLSVNDPGTPIPSGWSRVPLLRVARQETGHTPSRSHPEWWDGDVPWIGIKDASIHHGKIINDTLQATNASGLANSAARLLPAGTVCLSRTASVGYVVVMGRDMATSQDFVTWTCSSALLPKFLMYALMAEGSEIRRFGKGSTHTTIYFPEVRAMYIALAPLEEQHEIVRKIETTFMRLDLMIAESARAETLLDRLDQAALAKAFRGELIVHNGEARPQGQCPIALICQHHDPVRQRNKS